MNNFKRNRNENELKWIGQNESKNLKLLFEIITKKKKWKEETENEVLNFYGFDIGSSYK